MTPEFWSEVERLLAENPITIDRPRGQPHPRFADLIYPLDYGYLENTSAGDGDGIDIWIGTKPDKTLTGILCSIDRLKRDAEIKLLLGCTPADIETILSFNATFMGYLYIPKP